MSIPCEIDGSGIVVYRSNDEISREIQEHVNDTTMHLYKDYFYTTPFSPQGYYCGDVSVPQNVHYLKIVAKLSHPHCPFTVFPDPKSRWVGFDCAHINDYIIGDKYGHNTPNTTFKTRSFVACECRRIIDVIMDIVKEHEHIHTQRLRHRFEHAKAAIRSYDIAPLYA